MTCNFDVTGQEHARDGREMSAKRIDATAGSGRLRRVSGGRAAFLLAALAASSYLGAGFARGQTRNGVQGSAWRDSISQAEAQAAKDHKLVLVYIYAPWDQYSQRVDHEVWSNASVQAALSASFAAFRVNGDTPEGHAIRSRYSANTYPTFLFLEPSGDAILRAPGIGGAPGSVGTMLSRFKLAAAYAAQAARANAILAKNPNDAAGWALRAKTAAKGWLKDRALAYLKRARELDPTNKTGMLASAYNALGDAFQLDSQFDRAIEMFEAGRELSRTNNDSYYSYVSLASCYSTEGKPKMVRRIRDQMVREMPGATPSERQTIDRLAGIPAGS